MIPDRFRIKPPTRSVSAFLSDTSHEQFDEEEEMEQDEPEEQDPPETYRAKYTCSNCGAENEDDVEWGCRIDETTFECPKCGCET